MNCVDPVAFPIYEKSQSSSRRLWSCESVIWPWRGSRWVVRFCKVALGVSAARIPWISFDLLPGEKAIQLETLRCSIWSDDLLSMSISSSCGTVRCRKWTRYGPLEIDSAWSLEFCALFWGWMCLPRAIRAYFFPVLKGSLSGSGSQLLQICSTLAVEVHNPA